MAEVVNSAAVNESKAHVVHNRSRFNLSHKIFNTHRFGYYVPHFVLDGVPGDKHRIRSNSDLRSYSLKAPLLQNISRHLDYIKVDYPAILPMNFDKFYQNPTLGDDVTVDVGCCVENFPKKVANAFQSVFNNYKANWKNSDYTDANVTILFKTLVLAELFYSEGSLLNSLGCDITGDFYATIGTNHYDFDQFFDLVVGQFVADVSANAENFDVYIDAVPYEVYFGEVPFPGANKITFSHFLELIRGTSDWTFNTGGGEIAYFTLDLSGTQFAPVLDSKIPVNLARVFAYQLACAEFFTNDFVDYIYSAELYRQFIGSLSKDFITTYFGGSSYPTTFTYNGVEYQYDFLSARYFSTVLALLTSTPTAITTLSVLQYIISVLAFNRSLRYKDYFVGSRTRPLAVGDVTVNVASNQFSVVDVSKKIQVQRFLNAVNHTGRRLSNYVKTMFGVDIQQDRHVPHFIMNLSEVIFSSEVENTGVDQLTEPQTITSNFRSRSGNYEVEVGVDVPCIIIGVTSYDIERSYVGTIDRHFFIRDRFDMFLPQMQFVGDQPVYIHELNGAHPQAFGTTFGYQFRNMEDKLVPSRSIGGFVKHLPGYNFAYRAGAWPTPNVNPDFIRSLASELDQFYISLTGYSLASYFHFIVATDNIVDSSREMIANPEILG